MLVRLVFVVLILSAALSCGADDGAADAGAAPTASGSLGVVTQAAADRALEGLCTLSTGSQTFADASSLFFDRVHEELHVIAAAAQVGHRTQAARLLQTKEEVEADLQGGTTLPDGFQDDVAALLDATRGALAAVGMSAPTCDALGSATG